MQSEISIYKNLGDECLDRPSCVQQVSSTPQRKEEYIETTFPTNSKNTSSLLSKELHNINATNMSEYSTESSSLKCWKRWALHMTDVKTNISLKKASLKYLWMSSMLNSEQQ